MVEKRSFAQKIRPWLPALLWVGVIAWESSGIFTAENTTHWLYALVSAVFGPVDLGRLGFVHAILRKSGHFIGYAILSYFFLRAWRGQFPAERDASGAAPWRKPWNRQWAVDAVLLTVLVAALDEFHQTFVPGRTGVPRDVVLDGLGAVFAQLVVLLFNVSRLGPREISAKEELASRGN